MAITASSGFPWTKINNHLEQLQENRDFPSHSHAWSISLQPGDGDCLGRVQHGVTRRDSARHGYLSQPKMVIKMRFKMKKMISMEQLKPEIPVISTKKTPFIKCFPWK
jgi:hypothetical protein